MTLTITIEDGKSPEVTGPLNNKLVCYGMLELARDLIKDYKPQEIIPVSGFQLKRENGERG